ncbi:MAG TPA: hypothetical protein VIK31_14805 [Propionibacteriaceae bacterium]
MDPIQFRVELGDPLLRQGVEVVLHATTRQQQGPVHCTYGRGTDRRRIVEVLDRDAREAHVRAHDDGDDGRVGQLARLGHRAGTHHQLLRLRVDEPAGQQRRRRPLLHVIESDGADAGELRADLGRLGLGEHLDVDLGQRHVAACDDGDGLVIVGVRHRTGHGCRDLGWQLGQRRLVERIGRHEWNPASAG